MGRSGERRNAPCGFQAPCSPFRGLRRSGGTGRGGLSGVGGKLPNVAALQAEYVKLQEQKETLCADYGRLKKQVKEYDVIKRNIDSFLRRESEPERGKENVRG